MSSRCDRRDRWDLVPLLRRREIDLDQIRAQAIQPGSLTRQAVSNFLAGRNKSPRIAAAISQLTGLDVTDVLLGRAA